MSISKKLSMFIFSLLLVLTSFLFVACGANDYSKTKLECSVDSLELYVDESKTITFTIQNPVDNMDKTLNVNLSNPKVCTIEQTAVEGYSIKYTITGKMGGNTFLDVSTIEGNKKHSIKINVRQYSDKLEPDLQNSLYVSFSKTLTPSSADFIFTEEATERQLNYYFYGIVMKENELTIEDIKKDEQFVNEFSKVELVNIQDNDYLIFTDKEDKKYTIDNGQTIIENSNKAYSFIEVVEDENGYQIDPAEVSSVAVGDIFTFVATYTNETGDTILCERKFNILPDINTDSVVYDYGYKVQDMDFIPGIESSYKFEGLDKTKITLIPNYTSTIMNGALVGKKVDYVTVFLEVTIETTTDLLKMKVISDDTIVNSTMCNKVVANGFTTYYFQINSSTGKSAATDYKINFYYEGFENSSDKNVNFTYSIPVEIRVIPTVLLVNHVDLNKVDKEYVFYNNYAGSKFGWQQFQFNIIPEGAEYDSLEIDLTDSNLQMKVVSNKTTIYSNEKVVITDLNNKIYLKGLDGCPITEDVKNLPVKLNFNIIQEDYKETNIKYKIVKGVTKLDFRTPELKENIYIDYNVDNVLFADIYADAEFSTMEFELTSGVDVAKLSYDIDNPYNVDGIDYLLNINVSPKAIGSGSYTVKLDNGKQTILNIVVLDSLNTVSIKQNNSSNIITKEENVPAKAGIPAMTFLYAYNKNGLSYFNVQVLANNKLDSLAIKNVEIKLSSQIIEVGEAIDNNKNFNVYLKQNGSSKIELSVYGFQIEEFVKKDCVLQYLINIDTYDFINRLNIYKDRDGEGAYQEKVKASHAYVYSNTKLEKARTLDLNVDIENKNAFLFLDPKINKYVPDFYQLKYLFWSVPGDFVTIYRDGEPRDRMYYDKDKSNIYTIGSYGTFDAKTLTFVSNSNLTRAVNFALIGHIVQFGEPYAFTVNISISKYAEVNAITMQNPVETLDFSAITPEKHLIAYAYNYHEATNPKIVALFRGGQLSVGEQIYNMFNPLTENDYIESDNKFEIRLKVNPDYISQAEANARLPMEDQQKLQGVLYIVAEDWLDSSGNILAKYQSRAKEITVNFANGTKANRFPLESANDLLFMKNNMSAHYKITTTFDISSIADQLPLGELKGSIIGLNEQAKITGVNIFNPYRNSTELIECNYYGIFTKVAKDAYINYVSFDGQFNIGDKDSKNENKKTIAGLVTAVNDGNLINIGVSLNASNIYMNNGSIGAVAGQNNGLIEQDFTMFDNKSNNIQYFSNRAGEIDESIFYINKTPKITVFMKNVLNVYLGVFDNSNNNSFDEPMFAAIGGLVGCNTGTIRKIDSFSQTYSGYTNYMAYSRINVFIEKILFEDETRNEDYINHIFEGALIGRNKGNNSFVQGGYKTAEGFKTYNTYNILEKQNIEKTEYNAGKGILVGGEIFGYGNISGVIGYLDKLQVATVSYLLPFAGITSRTFVRGYAKNTVLPKVAAIANIKSLDKIGDGVSQQIASLTSAFAMQAVDDGKQEELSSMIVIYNGSCDKELKKYTDDSDNIAFGLYLAKENGEKYLNAIDVMKDFKGENKRVNSDGSIGEEIIPEYRNIYIHIHYLELLLRKLMIMIM